MKADTRQTILVVALTVFLFGMFTLFFWDFVRETIAVPIYYLFWTVDLLLKTLPQEIYLAILVGVCVLICANTVRGLKVKRADTMVFPNQYEGVTRYQFWAKTAANLHSSAFAREQFAREARKLILAILAYQEGVNASEIEVMIRKGRLNVPGPIVGLIDQRELQVEARTTSIIKNVLSWWRRLLAPEAVVLDPEIDRQVNEIISFIEQQLEITYAENQQAN